jgi:hypothetical protein
VGQAKQQISDSADISAMSQDLQSLADLHPKRIVSSLAEAPATPTDPPRPSGGGIDPNAT